MCSPAPAKAGQRQKAQQALTKYVRYDNHTRASKTQLHQQKPGASTAADSSQSPLLLNAKPVKAGQSIAAALSRQAGKAVPRSTAASAVSRGKVVGGLKTGWHTGQQETISA